MGIRIHKAPKPGKGQEEFNLFPEDSLPLNERFKDVPTPERGLRVTIGREMEHFRYLLQGIASGKDARTEEEMEQAWVLLGQWNQMTDMERGESINRLKLEHEYPVVSRRGITIAAIREAFRRVDRDEPAEIVQKLTGPFSHDDIQLLLRYAIDQGLTTRADVMADWNRFGPKSTMGVDGALEKLPKRVFANFLIDAHLPDWRRKAQKRLEAAVQPQPLRPSKSQTISAPADRQPSTKPHRRSTLF